MKRATILLLLLLLLFPSVAWALTPIAQTNVVPNQRIEYGTTFNFGVIAFCKDGIEKVDFVISGQGYASGTKTATAWRLNTRTASVSPGTVRSGTWEYYVEIPSSEFSTNGIITVTPTVHDDGSADTRVLAAVTMYVEGASNEAPTEAWVDFQGSDGTGTLDNESDPFISIASAVSAIETQNGDSDYAIIYLAEDTYDDSDAEDEIGAGSITTTNEWLTITKESGATTANVIIANDDIFWNGGGYLKFQGIMFDSQDDDYALLEIGIWLDQNEMLGSGNELAAPYPVQGWGYATGNHYQDTQIFIAGPNQKIARGNKIDDLYDDFSRHIIPSTGGILVVNNYVDGIHGSFAGSHSDLSQFDSNVENFIWFNNIFFSSEYQQFYMDSDSPYCSEIAFVNNVIEIYDGPTDGYTPWGAIFDTYTHLLLWHNTFCSRDGVGTAEFYSIRHHHRTGGETAERTYISYIGNVFITTTYDIDIKPFLIDGGRTWDQYLDSGNSFNNEANYNHYMRGDTFGENTSTGAGVIDVDTPGSIVFGHPRINSGIVDRLPSNLTGIPCDAYGNPRDSKPDVGAIELQSEEKATMSRGSSTSSKQ